MAKRDIEELEEFRREARQLYGTIEDIFGPEEAKRVFLEFVSSKRQVRRYQNAELLAHYFTRRHYNSRLSLWAYAVEVAAENKEKVSSVYTRLGRLMKQMARDKDFKDHVRFLAHPDARL